jgi:hypothetical protein
MQVPRSDAFTFSVTGGLDTSKQIKHVTCHIETSHEALGRIGSNEFSALLALASNILELRVHS